MFLQSPTHNFIYYLKLVLVNCLLLKNRRKTFNPGFILPCHIPRVYIKKKENAWKDVAEIVSSSVECT